MDKDKQSSFSQLADKMRERYPLRSEQSKFTYYDERGHVIYVLLSDINMKIVQLHDNVLLNVFTDIDYNQVVGRLPCG